MIGHKYYFGKVVIVNDAKIALDSDGDPLASFKPCLGDRRPAK